MEEIYKKVNELVIELNNIYAKGELDKMEYVQMLNNLEQAMLTYEQTHKQK